MASENNVHALQHTTLKTVNYAIYKCCMEDAMFLGILNLFSSWIFFALHVDSMGVFPKPLSKQKEEEYFEKMAVKLAAIHKGRD